MVKLEELTPNEIAWLRFLRDISNDSDSQPTLMQLLRRVRRREWRCRWMRLRVFSGSVGAGKLTAMQLPWFLGRESVTSRQAN